MKLLLVTCVLLAALAGCARVPPPLECTVQQENPKSEFVSHDYPSGYRLTVSFNDPQRLSIIVGDVFGSQEHLKKTASKYYENAENLDGQSIEDLNVYHYSVVRQTPVPYESWYQINMVSGQMYHEKRVGSEVSRMLYAHCERAAL